MIKWTSQRLTSTKRFHVKVKPLKLEGFVRESTPTTTANNNSSNVEEEDDDDKEITAILEMNWEGPKSAFVPFCKSLSLKRRRNCSSQRFLRKGESNIEWDDDEFESICDFSIASKDGSFGPWDVSFTVFYGDSAESKTKLAVLGKASLNLADVAAKMESKVETKLPVTSKVDGFAKEATLMVSVSFAEVRNSIDSPGNKNVQNSDSDKGDRLINKMVMGLTGYKKKNKETKGNQVSSCESDEFASDSVADTTRNESIVTSSGSEPSSGGGLSTSSSETQSDNPVQKDGFFSWKRRRLSFRPQLKKGGEPMHKKTNDNNKVSDDDVDHQLSNSDLTTSDSVQNTKNSTESSSKKDSCNPSNWEMKELVSRDGQTKLKANAFLASFDQRSEKAAGESACTALVAVIAHWLHSNQNSMPTRSEYDELITEGSSEWRKLCDNHAYTNLFPDKHFDLETVIEAGLKPITVVPAKSFTGFFSPEKFESLKGAMSFDEIWNEINDHTGEVDYKPRVYVISWNDHFFVLKVEADAYYIIDSLGERLFEGCKQAYILKFDDSTSMKAKIAKKEVSSGEMVGEEEKTICSGKECCKEYIKRFLAAIPVKELEAEEKKGTVSTIALHQRLQIEFHYSSFSSSTVSSSLSLSSSIEE